jgi:hypothetical protein
MGIKLVELSLIVLVLFSNILLSSNNLNKTFASGGSWYVGDGAKKDMFVKYKIQEHDTNNARPFNITIYFKDFNSTGNYWVAPTFIVDQGRVINGTFHLSDLDMTALGSSKIPPEMHAYRSAYTSSLTWLSAFVPKPGQSLSAAYWGKIAAIGGSPIQPSGKATVTVPAGTFDTTVISWHKGVDNSIWINPDMPYPVKAQTYADVTTGNPPLQYAFQLLELGRGQPMIPSSIIRIPESPLIQQTARGTYFIQLFWTAPIKTTNETQMGILFKDNSQNVINGVSYGFKVTSPNGTLIKEATDQKATDGTGIQEVRFPSVGRYTVAVTVEAQAGTPLGMFVEQANFEIVAEN